MGHYNLLSVGQDAKTVKGEKHGFLTACLALSPHTLGGGPTVCPHSTPGCRAGCLFNAGRASFFQEINPARQRKKDLFHESRDAFLALLVLELGAFEAECQRKGMTPSVRLNMMSDIRWEKLGVPQKFPEMGFYDYTKWPLSGRKGTPDNYQLVYSLSEHPKSWTRALEYIASGHSVAVVFRTEEQKLEAIDHGFRGLAVLDGDQHDIRRWDSAPIVGLRAKGIARHDTTGFVMDYEPTMSIPTMAVLEMAMKRDVATATAA